MGSGYIRLAESIPLNSFESIPELLKRLQIRARTTTNIFYNVQYYDTNIYFISSVVLYI